MHSTTVAVDLAKNVFELAVTDSEGKIDERLRLSRARFAAFFVQRPPCRVLMEACGSAHYWARRITAYGHAWSCSPLSMCVAMSDAARPTGPMQRR
jgi:transposase